MNEKIVEILKSIAAENNDTLPELEVIKTTLLEKGCTEEEITEFIEKMKCELNDDELESAVGGISSNIFNKLPGWYF